MPSNLRLRHPLSSFRRVRAATVTALLLTAAIMATACSSEEPITPEDFCVHARTRFQTISNEFDDTVATADAVNSLNVAHTTRQLEQNSVRLRNFMFDLSEVSTNIQPTEGDAEQYVEFAENFDDHTLHMSLASTSMKSSIRKYREEWEVDNFNRFIASLAEFQDNGIGAFNNMTAICALAGLPTQ